MTAKKKFKVTYYHSDRPDTIHSTFIEYALKSEVEKIFFRNHSKNCKIKSIKLCKDARL